MQTPYEMILKYKVEALLNKLPFSKIDERQESSDSGITKYSKQNFTKWNLYLGLL